MSGHPVVVIAGAAGDLGGRITKALIARNAVVHALVRPDVAPQERLRIERTGAKAVLADPGNLQEMTDACRDAACVVSALNGVRNVMIDRQRLLLDAAVKAGVPRFIPSDYSEDFTKTDEGRNRNLDLRREFKTYLDLASIKATSVLNGAFMDMLGADMPIIRRRLHRVIYWGSADQPLDFTTKDNVAAYTAAAAMDEMAPRILRIAGETVSARQIAEVMSGIDGKRYRTLRVGGIASLGLLIGITKLVAPQADKAFPPWQGMQYMRDMFSGQGKLTPLDNDRYPGLVWTSAQEHLLSVERPARGDDSLPRTQGR